MHKCFNPNVNRQISFWEAAGVGLLHRGRQAVSRGWQAARWTGVVPSLTGVHPTLTNTGKRVQKQWQGSAGRPVNAVQGCSNQTGPSQGRKSCHQGRDSKVHRYSCNIAQGLSLTAAPKLMDGDTRKSYSSFLCLLHSTEIWGATEALCQSPSSAPAAEAQPEQKWQNFCVWCRMWTVTT